MTAILLVTSLSILSMGVLAITGIGGFTVETDTLQGNNVNIHGFPMETAACEANIGDNPEVAGEDEEAIGGIRAEVEQIVIPADSGLTIQKDIETPEILGFDAIRIKAERGNIAFDPDYPPQAPRGPRSDGQVAGSLVDEILFAGVDIGTGSNDGYSDLRFQRTRNVTDGETVPIQVTSEGTYDYSTVEADRYPVAEALNEERFLDGVAIQSLEQTGAGSDGGYGDYTDLSNSPDNLSRSATHSIEVFAQGTEPSYDDVNAPGAPDGDNPDSTVEDVFFGGIENTDASETGGYADYTDINTDRLEKGETYTLEVSGSKVSGTYEEAEQQSDESIEADCDYLIYEFEFAGIEWVNDDGDCFETPADGTGINTDAISPGSVIDVSVDTEEAGDGSVTFMWVDWHQDGFNNNVDRYVIGAIAPDEGRETHSRQLFVPDDAEPGTASIRLMTAYLGEEGQTNYAWNSTGSDCEGADGEDYTNCEGQVIDWTAHTNPTSQVSAFFDWNQDGEIDDRVNVGRSLDKTDGYTYTADIEVPDTAKSGSLPMRLVHRNDLDILEPLPEDDDYVGEAHDYRVDVEEMRADSGVWAYIDWNQDGSFDDRQLIDSVRAPDNYGSFTAEGILEVPDDAAAGSTAVRVVHQQDGYPNLERELALNWRMDEGSGTTLGDSSDNNNEGSIDGADWIDIPEADSALEFDGVEDNATLDGDNMAGMPEGTDVTHTKTAWVRVDSVPDEREWVSLLGQAGEGAHHWLLQDDGNGELLGQFGAFGGPQTNVGPALEVGEWAHVAVTFDGDEITSYVDGEVVDTAQTSAGDFDFENTNLEIAQDQVGESNFEGALDDFRVYNRALSEDAIENLFRLGQGNYDREDIPLPGPDEEDIDGEYHDYSINVEPDASYVRAWAAWDVDPSELASGETVDADDFELVADFDTPIGSGTTENVGPFTLEDEIEVPEAGEIEEKSVAVGQGNETISDVDRIVTALENELGDEFTEINVEDADEMASNPGPFMDEYDVIVVNDWDEEVTTVDEVEGFLDEAEATETPLVMMHNFWDGSAYTGAVVWQHRVEDDPEDIDGYQDFDEGDIFFQIEESSTLWEGVGDPGDTVRVYTEGEFGTHAWWEEYSGSMLARVESEEVGMKGPGASIKSEDNRCLLALGATTNEGEYTEEGERIIANCVESLAPGGDEQGARLIRVTHKQGVEPPEPDEGTEFRGETLDITAIRGPAGDISDDGNLTLGDASFTVSNLQAEELTADDIVIDESFVDNTEENPKFGPDGELQLDAESAVMEDVTAMAHEVTFAFFQVPEIQISVEFGPDDPMTGFDVCPVAPPPDGMVVEITGTNEEGVNEFVEEGETLEVDVNVWNNQDETDTQEILLEVDGETRDTREVTLDPDDDTDTTLEWETGDGDAGEFEATVLSDDDVDQTEVEVVEEVTPPEFKVDITGTNEPVIGGVETLEVEAEIENEGLTPDEQDIELEIFNGEDFGVVDTETVQLDARDSETLTLEWEPGEDDDGDYTAEVSSNNDTDTEAVTVQEPQPPTFEVDITGTNSPIAETQELIVQAEVENVGDLEGTQNIVLNILDEDGDDVIEEETDTEEVSLERGESTDLELRWDTEEGDAGNYTAEIASEDDTDTEDVLVEDTDPPDYQVTVTDVDEDEEGFPIDVTAEITNEGEVEGFQDIILDIFESDGETVVEEEADVEENVILDPGESATVTLTWETEEGDAGDYVANVSSNDDSDTEPFGLQDGDFRSMNLVDRVDDWNEGEHTRASADRDRHSGELGIGYVDGTTESETQPGAAGDYSLVWYGRADDDGDPTIDYSGNNRDGVIYGDASPFADGVFSTPAYDIPGTFEGDFFTDGVWTDEAETTDLGITGGGSRSISVWVHPRAAHEAGGVFHYGDSRDDGEAFTFRQTCAGERDESGGADWVLDGGDDESFDACSNPGAFVGEDHHFFVEYEGGAVGEWTHFVVTFDGSSTTIYADGQEIDSKDMPLDTDTTDDDGDSQAVRFGDWGERRGTFESDDGYSIDGRLDEMMIFDSALSTSEVEDLYLEQSGSFQAEHDSKNLDALDDDDVDDPDRVDWREVTIDATVPSADTEATVELVNNIGEELVVELEDGVNTYDLEDEWSREDTHAAVADIEGTSTDAEETWSIDEIDIEYRVFD